MHDMTEADDGRETPIMERLAALRGYEDMDRAARADALRAALSELRSDLERTAR